MKRRRRYTDDQIVSILLEHSGGVTAAEVIRRHGISLDTLYRWKRKYRGVDKVELHRLKTLELAQADQVIAPELPHTTGQMSFSDRGALIAAGAKAATQALARIKPLFEPPKPP